MFDTQTTKKDFAVNLMKADVTSLGKYHRMFLVEDTIYLQLTSKDTCEKQTFDNVLYAHRGFIAAQDQLFLREKSQEKEDAKFREHGFENRDAYMEDLADINGISVSEVHSISSVLGRNEDFDGLVSEVEDYANNFSNL